MGLLDLALKYRTDKAFFYASFYEDLLKGLEVRNMLEIGIGSQESMKDSIARAGWTDYIPGASLRMWAEYFPYAELIGLDNDLDVLFRCPRIKTTWFEQSDSSTYPVLDHDFDLIIDDGSHKREDQLLARSMLFPMLRLGGIYITEDITDPDSWPDACARFKNEYGEAAISWLVK